MPINANIALQGQPVQLENPLNMMAKYAALQQAQQEQQMNALKMQEYQRSVGTQNALRQLYADPTIEPGSLKAVQAAYRIDPAVGAAMHKDWLAGENARRQAESAAATAAHANAQTSKLQLEQTMAKLDRVQKDLANTNSYADAVALLDQYTQLGITTPDAAAKSLASMPRDDAAFGVWKKGELRKMLTAAQQLEKHYVAQNLGGTAQVVAVDKFGDSGAQVVSSTPTTMAPGTQERIELEKQRVGLEGKRVELEGKRVEQGKVPAGYKQLPDGTLTFIPGGPADPNTKPPRTNEETAAYNTDRILKAASTIDEIIKKDPSALQPGASEAAATAAGLPGAANIARSSNRQIVHGAQRDAVDAVLYLATGAAYNREQREAMIDAYVPVWSDKKENIAAKQARLVGLIESAKTRAGKAWTPEMDRAMKSLIGANPQESAGKISGVAKVTNDADYDALPSGAEFVGPDGIRRRKP